MTANVVHPAELEHMLEARVADARIRRAEAGRSRARTGARRARRGSVALVAGAMLALSAAAVWATHGGTLIDLTADEAQVEHNDAIFTQGGVGAGTGNFDPYLTLSPGGNVDTESGYNLCSEPVFGFANADVDCPDPEFDELTGGDRTHLLRVSSIPVVEVGGELYREFHLDSNDAGSDPWMAITEIELYLETDPDLTFSEFAVPANLIWDLDGDTDQTILMNTQSLESGSGVSDISILIPDGLFPDECYYGSTNCDTFLYFYTESGDPTLDTNDDRNWNTTAGFEEWRIELLPVVNVQKSVTTSFDRTYPWDITKSANVESIDLFAGETAEIDWTVDVTVGTPTDSDESITGTIAIQNPTGNGFAIEDAIPAVVTDVDDVLSLGADLPANATVTCPSAFPFTVAAGATVNCTYSYAPGDTDNGTNTATVTIETNEEGDTASYSDTEAVNFGAGSVNTIDECVEVTDDNATPGDSGDDTVLDASLCVGDPADDFTFEFSTDVGPFDVAECDSVTITNTAYTETNDTATPDSASDSVDVTCYKLSVAKTAETSLARTWAWDITKSADVETIDLFAGDSATITWTVTVTGLGSTDSAWHVEGDITITNPAPIAAEDVAVADSISGFGSVAVDCDPGTAGNQATVDVPAAAAGTDGEATCTYETDLPDGTTRTNTGTATLFGEEYSGTASVDFSGATVDDIDECIDVWDDSQTPLDETDDVYLGEVCLDDLDENDEFTFPTFTTDVGPFGVDECDSTSVTNVASSVTNDTETDDSADDTVDVNCYELTVSKDATTTYSRDYDWSIEKTRFIAEGEDDGDGDPLTLTLDEGQTYTASYEITVTMTGSTDDDHAVSGTITISNPAPIAADDVAVVDVISHATEADIAATVDCDSVTEGSQATVDIPAEDSVQCSYSADLPNADDRLNTATATLFGEEYEGTANVTFDLENPTTEIDECIDITDDAGTLDTADDLDLGTVCVDDLDENNQWSDEYTLDIGPFAVCGEYSFTNTVSFVTTDDENDTDESGFDTYTVSVDVPCPEGCTLTQGYWKTHNDSFWGGAPSDETWDLLGDVDGDGVEEAEGELFFLSGMTYFDVMWSSPKGNAYFNLATQYIAAKLNMLDGADGSAITSAFNSATTLFQTYADEQIAALKGKNGNALRAQFISLAGTLASYNEGLIGPGHCDEDSSSSLTGTIQLIADRRTGFSIG